MNATRNLLHGVGDLREERLDLSEGSSASGAPIPSVRGLQVSPSLESGTVPHDGGSENAWLSSKASPNGLTGASSRQFIPALDPYFET
jgi:hypothetical protein